MKALKDLLRDVDAAGPYPADAAPLPPPPVERAAILDAYRRLQAWLPITDGQWPRPPIGPWDGRQRVAETQVIGRLIFAYVQDWWADPDQLALYADVDRYEIDEGHNALAYWPPMRVLQRTKTRGALHLRMTTVAEEGLEELRYALRLAAIHGIASVVLDGPPALVHGLWGWLDVRFNHNSNADIPRPFNAFASAPAGPVSLTWSPPAMRLWARMTDAERGDAGRSVLRFASAVQDWAATVGKHASRFVWAEEAATVNGALLFIAPLGRVSQWERIHGIPEEGVHALASAGLMELYCLHVRVLKLYEADAEGRFLALINAFFVELVRTLDFHLSLDAEYTDESERVLYLGHVAAGAFVYPTWQPGTGPWPYFYRLRTPDTYTGASDIFFAPAGIHRADYPNLRYVDPEGMARLLDLEKAGQEGGDEELIVEDVRETMVRADKRARPAATEERPTKRARTQARCYTCQRLHARVSGLALAPARLCSDECYRIYSLRDRNNGGLE
jgi:hypothetical protein